MNTCYTINIGNYDEIKPPRILSEGWEYILFSDRFIDCPPWRCVITTKHNREIKIKADDLFKNLTLYVDGSIEIIGDLNQFCCEVPNWYSAWKHPHRDSVTKEADAVIRLKGCDADQVHRQMRRYEADGFRDDMGLAACGVLLRDLSDSTVRHINKMWFEEFQNGVKRDQISFMYSFYRMGLEPDMFGNSVFNKYFKWGQHL